MANCSNCSNCDVAEWDCKAGKLPNLDEEGMVDDKEFECPYFEREEQNGKL